MLGQAEVEQLRLAGAGDHDIFGLEVAVNDSQLVRGGYAVGHLTGELDRLAHGQRAAIEPGAQRLALHQFGDDVGASVVFSDVINSHDVRMIQRAQRAGLKFEARPPGRIGGHLRRQNLQSHQAL